VVAPTVRDSTTAVTLGGTSVVVTKPSGVVEHDKLYLMAVTTTGPTVTPPTDFVEIATRTQGVNIMRLYEKPATASEPANYTYGLSGTSNVEVILVAVVNAKLGLSALDVAVSVNSSGVSGSTLTALGVTTSQVDCLLLAFGGIQAVSDFTSNDGLTEMEDGTFTTSGYDEAPSAGATGDRTFTATASNVWIAMLAAIAPIPPASDPEGQLIGGKLVGRGLLGGVLT